jgi:lipopolysaccharide transport system permease protein
MTEPPMPAFRSRGAKGAVHSSARPVLSFAEFGPHLIFASLTRNVGLVVQLTEREIAGRYRGSVLGLAWSFVTPLLMLAIYTFVFSVVFQARWDTPVENRFEFALILFCGLIVFYLFAECIGRAPGLLAENVTYIKRVVFPLEALAWVSVLNALFNALVNLTVLLVVHLVVVGLPPPTVFWVPIVIAPFALLMLGVVWFLASMGLYVRDIRHLVAIIVPMFMFASPLFYPVSALPEGLRAYMRLNPLAVTIEGMRDVILFGNQPDLGALAISFGVAVVVAWGGLVWFLLTKRGFADVV